jgi:DNA-binding transcriptional MerR regulator
MGKVNDSFSTGEAVRLTGVPFRTMDYWAETGFITPSIAEARGTGTERRYAFKDLVTLRMARELREAGVSTQALRRAVAYLKAHENLTNPLAESRVILIGRDIQVLNEDASVTSVLRKPGQTAFAFMFDLPRVVTQIRADVVALIDRKPVAKDTVLRVKTAPRRRA